MTSPVSGEVTLRSSRARRHVDAAGQAVGLGMRPGPQGLPVAARSGGRRLGPGIGRGHGGPPGHRRCTAWRGWTHGDRGVGGGHGAERRPGGTAGDARRSRSTMEGWTRLPEHLEHDGLVLRRWTAGDDADVARRAGGRQPGPPAAVHAVDRARAAVAGGAACPRARVGPEVGRGRRCGLRDLRRWRRGREHRPAPPPRGGGDRDRLLGARGPPRSRHRPAGGRGPDVAGVHGCRTSSGWRSTTTSPTCTAAESPSSWGSTCWGSPGRPAARSLPRTPASISSGGSPETSGSPPTPSDPNRVVHRWGARVTRIGGCQAGKGLMEPGSSKRMAASWVAWPTRVPVESHSSQTSSTRPPLTCWAAMRTWSGPGAGTARR